MGRAVALNLIKSFGSAAWRKRASVPRKIPFRVTGSIKLRHNETVMFRMQWWKYVFGQYGTFAMYHIALWVSLKFICPVYLSEHQHVTNICPCAPCALFYPAENWLFQPDDIYYRKVQIEYLFGFLIMSYLKYTAILICLYVADAAKPVEIVK